MSTIHLTDVQDSEDSDAGCLFSESQIVLFGQQAHKVGFSSPHIGCEVSTLSCTISSAPFLLSWETDASMAQPRQSQTTCLSYV